MKIAITVLALLLATSAHAFKCGNKIISEDDSIHRVVQNCGAPQATYEQPLRDEITLYYTLEDGKYVLLFRDGTLRNIDWSR